MAAETRTQFGIAIPQVSLNEKFDPSLISRFVTKVEALGYHSGWVQERMLGGLPTLDAIPLLTYAAAFRSRLKLGTSVMLTALSSPVALAKNLASLDQLSGGRIIAGIGLGGSKDIYPAFGISSKGRVRRFEEGIQLLKELWTKDRVTFNGRYWQLEDTATNSHTVQQPHPPIWFGAHVPAALRRAVKMGDGWMGAGNSTTAEFKEELKVLRQILEEERRDPSTFALSKRVYVAVTDDKKQESERFQDWFGKHYGNSGRSLEVSVIGGEQECVEKLAEVVSEGIDLLMINPIFDPIEQAERLSQDVLPKIK